MWVAITSCLRNWLANYTGSVNKSLCVFTISKLWAVWHFPLSKRNTWKTRITAIIKKGNKLQKTPVSLSLPLPVASPWPRFCSKIRVPFKGHWPHCGNKYLLFKRNEYQPFPFANEIVHSSETSESLSFEPSFQKFSSSGDALQVLQLSTSLIGSGQSLTPFHRVLPSWEYLRSKKTFRSRSSRHLNTYLKLKNLCCSESYGCPGAEAGIT